MELYNIIPLPKDLFLILLEYLETPCKICTFIKTSCRKRGHFRGCFPIIKEIWRGNRHLPAIRIKLDTQAGFGGIYRKAAGGKGPEDQTLIQGNRYSKKGILRLQRYFRSTR